MSYPPAPPSSFTGPTYYLIRPGGQPEGPLDRAAVQSRAAPGTIVTHGNSWVPLESHPDFAGFQTSGCVHSFPSGSQYCIKCGILNPTFGRQGNINSASKTGPSSWVALWGLLLPGLPQIILGQTAKGLFIMVLIIVMTLSVALVPIAGFLNIGFMIDATRVAAKIRRMGRVEPWEFMPS